MNYVFKQIFDIRSDQKILPVCHLRKKKAQAGRGVLIKLHKECQNSGKNWYLFYSVKRKLEFDVNEFLDSLEQESTWDIDIFDYLEEVYEQSWDSKKYSTFNKPHIFTMKTQNEEPVSYITESWPYGTTNQNHIHSKWVSAQRSILEYPHLTLRALEHKRRWHWGLLSHHKTIKLT